jgi:hypothetical protein
LQSLKGVALNRPDCNPAAIADPETSQKLAALETQVAAEKSATQLATQKAADLEAQLAAANQAAADAATAAATKVTKRKRQKHKYRIQRII